MPQHNSHSHSAAFLQDNRIFYTAVLLIFLAACALRVYYMEHKTAVNMDESLSLTLSTYNGHGWDKDFVEGVEYSGEELRRLSYGIKPGLAGLLSDLGSLRRDSRDPPHTAFYYYFFRTALTGTPTLDVFDLLWRGTVLNLLFFGLAFVALYGLGRTLYGDDRPLLLTALLAASINAATLSCFLYVRPYELQALMLTVSTLITVRYVLRIRGGQPCPDYAHFLLHSVAVALCFLSGYFSLVYVFMLGLLLFVMSLKHGQGRYIPYFICLILLALTIAWAIYPSFLLALFYDRGTEAMEKISLAYMLQHAGYILDKFIYISDRHIVAAGGIAALVLGGVLSFRRKGTARQRGLTLALFFIALAWALLCFTVAPYKNLRYIMPAAPLLLLLGCVALQRARWRPALMGIFLLSVLVPAFMPSRIDYYQEYQSTPLPAQQQPYVASLSTRLRVGAFTPYFVDSQKVIFYNSCESLRENYRSRPDAVLVIDDAQFERCEMEDKGLRKLQSYVFFNTYALQ